ncbi:tyrosine-type recombinase/integrase [Pseudophaeobacter flagellatus]|uniref:tyrosine-type recombinase/integrase n=1 Tax=Pseudophaeobacter flagellatus TaxID=2899119 RepID=UPI001E36CE5A|nr:integrase family protein [Pseudophaeobacter flagellatus]MCD9146725.1 integrase family protein [Pseudophaeobacter flagellatus]
MVQLLLKADMVRDLPQTDAGQAFYFDTQTQGLGLRVGTRKKAYFAEGRVGGKKRRVTLGNTDQLTLADARKLAKKAVAEMVGGTDPNKVKAEQRAKGMTLGDAVDAFLSGRDHKASTAANYRNTLRRDFGDWHKRELRHITPQMTLDRFNKIMKRTPSGAALAMRTFRSCWNYARELTADQDGVPVLHDCPVRRVTALKLMPKATRRQNHITDFQAWFAAIDVAAGQARSHRHKNAGENFRDFCELLVRSGLRKSEAANLQWADVDFKGRTFTVAAERSKNGQPLTLPCSLQVLELFRRLRERHVEGAYIWGIAPLGDPRKTLVRAREALGEPFSFHDARRTFAVLAERLNVNYPKLRRMMNHADNDVTLGYLASRDPERLRNEMQMISDEIDRLTDAAIA